MARFNLSFLAIFVTLAAIAVSMPTKTDGLAPNQLMGLGKTLNDLKDATKMMNESDDEDASDKNDIQTAPSSPYENPSGDGDDDNEDTEEKDVKNNKPTKTDKKPTSGDFVTATATNTHHPTSKPNALGKIPILGGILGGTGAGL